MGGGGSGDSRFGWLRRLLIWLDSAVALAGSRCWAAVGEDGGGGFTQRLACVRLVEGCILSLQQPRDDANLHHLEEIFGAA